MWRVLTFSAFFTLTVNFTLMCIFFTFSSRSHAKSKSKSDNSKPKSLPPLTVYYTNVRGLRGNFTDFEAFFLKNYPDIFALCETNLHDDIQDSDFQLRGFLPNHRKDAGHMHGIGDYLKSNLLIVGETILEDENESYMFSVGSSTFYYLVSFSIFIILNCG